MYAPPYREKINDVKKFLQEVHDSRECQLAEKATQKSWPKNALMSHSGRRRSSKNTGNAGVRRD